MNSEKYNCGYFDALLIDKHDVLAPSVRELSFETETLEETDLGLTDCIWETYRVNALYNFSYDPEQFEEYQETLESCIEALNIKMESTYNSERCIVNIESLKSTVFCSADTPAVKISIMTEKEGYQVSCFTGFLLSIERNDDFMEKERKRAQAVILPLFLVDYSDKMYLDCVTAFLEDNFRCVISPLMFTTYDLIWMLALWSCPQGKKCTRSTILEYKVPLQNLSAIKYVIDPKTMSETWLQTLEPNTANEISEMQVEDFYYELKKNFYKMFSIDLSHFQLSLIKTPVARVQSDHSIIIFEKDELFPILTYLTHLSQEMR